MGGIHEYKFEFATSGLGEGRRLAWTPGNPCGQ